MSISPPSYGTPVARRTNGLATAALVLGLCGFALLPVIFGHIALRQIRERHESGTGLAIAGLVLGYIEIALYVIVAIVLALSLTAVFAFGTG